MLASVSVFASAFASTLGAQQASAQEAAEIGDDEVVVTGRRVSTAGLAIGADETSNTVAVTREALLSAPSGISGLKMLEGLPGFNVQTDGALGLYEFGNSVTVRAFNFNQIGFVLDGIPMGRPDAFGGSPIFRYVDNENLQVVRASPGAGDVSLPSATSLGPMVEYLTTEPSEEFAATISVAFGDDNLRRTFIKVQSGDINGFSGYVSRSKTDSDLWRGPGTIDREHLEGKAQYKFDEDTKISLQFVHNDFFDYDSPSVSRAQYESPTGDLAGNTGRDYAYLGYVPDLGFGPDVPYQNSNYTQYYIDRVNQREDLLVAGHFETNVIDGVTAHLTGYWESKDGYGVSPDTYSFSQANYLEQAAVGLPVVPARGVQYGLSTVGGDRYGAVGGAAIELGMHTIEIGAWYENETYHRGQFRTNKVGGNPAGEPLLDEIVYLRRDYTSERNFVQFNVKDSVSLFDDRLVVEAGFKSLFLDYELSGYRDFDDYSRVVGGMPVAGYGPQVVTSEFNDAFLPMVGAVFELTDTEQLFASYSQNFALPRGADDIYSVVTTEPPPELEGETSKNYEIGLRTNRPTFNAALAVYYVTFDNRIEITGGELAGSPGAIQTFAQNVGSVESYGVELTGNWKPALLRGYAYFNANLTYNKSTFQDDFNSLGLPGNELPDSPNWLATGGVTVEPTPWIVANVTARYVGMRYADFINTQEMESYTVLDAYLDIGDGFGVGPLKGVKARMNVTNITDKDTLSFTFTTVNGTAFYRPLAPRTFQFSLVGEF